MESNYPLLQLTNDVVFKMFFADKRSEDILAEFLRAVLELPQGELTELEILNPTISRINIDDKDYTVDVRVKTRSGEIKVFEMQSRNHKAFAERIACSNARTFSTQLKEGNAYTKLKRVSSIIITEFVMFKGIEKYHHIFEYRDESGLLFTDFQQIHTLELPKIPSESKSEKDNWMQFLKIKSEEAATMVAAKSPVLQKAVLRLRELSSDEEARQFAYELEEGRRIRLTLEETAKEEGKAEVAINMLKSGMDVEMVSKITNMPPDWVESLLTTA